MKNGNFVKSPESKETEKRNRPTKESKKRRPGAGSSLKKKDRGKMSSLGPVRRRNRRLLIISCRSIIIKESFIKEMIRKRGGPAPKNPRGATEEAATRGEDPEKTSTIVITICLQWKIKRINQLCLKSFKRGWEHLGGKAIQNGHI